MVGSAGDPSAVTSDELCADGKNEVLLACIKSQDESKHTEAVDGPK